METELIEKIEEKPKKKKKAVENNLWEFECNAILLKKIVSKIIKVNDEVLFTLTKEGLSSNVVDLAHVLMVSIDIPRKDFYIGNTCVNQEVHYTLFEDMEFGINIAKLDRTLRLTGHGSDRLKGWIEGNFLHIKGESFHKKIKLLDIAGMPKAKIPELKLGIKAEVKTGELAKLKKATETEDSVKLFVKDGLKAVIEDDDDDLTINLCKKDDVTGTGKAVYSSDYLNILLDGFSGSWYETVTIEFDTDIPIRVEGKAGMTGNCIYLLAPRIGSE